MKDFINIKALCKWEGWRGGGGGGYEVAAESDIAVPELVSQASGLASSPRRCWEEPWTTQAEQGDRSRTGRGSSLLLAQHIFRVEDTLGSSVLATCPRPFLLLGLA